MTLQRINFKELFEGVPVAAAGGTRTFLASGQQKNKNLPPQVFNEEDIKTAERDGYKKGFTEGVQEGCKQSESEQLAIDRNLTTVIDTFMEKLSPIFDNYRKMALQLQQDVPKVAVGVARKVAGHALDKNAHDMIFDTVARCCAAMIHEAKLTITIHETMADTLALRFKNLAARMPVATQIIIMRSPDMPMNDCIIEWEHGMMERSVEHIMKQAEKTVDNMIAASKRDTEQQLDLLSMIAQKTQNTTSAKE